MPAPTAYGQTITVVTNSAPVLYRPLATFSAALPRCTCSDVKTFLHDTTNWRNDQLQAQLAANASNFYLMTSSWQEQRDWGFTYALQALGSHPLRGQLEAAFSSIYPPSTQPSPSSADGWNTLAPGRVVNAGRFSIAFDPVTGAISYLFDSLTGQTWADVSKGALMGVVHYQTYTEADYTHFVGNYSTMNPPPSWFYLDFSKPDVTLANPSHQEMNIAFGGLWTRPSSDGTSIQFLVKLAYANASAHTYYGAAETVWMLVEIPTAADSNTIRLTYQMYNKTATRLPEALFIRFNATQEFAGKPCPQTWLAGKLGEWVDPTGTQSGGNQHHHGVHDGVLALRSNAAGAASTMTIFSPEAGLAVFGHPFGLPTPWDGKPDPLEGAAFMLSDNTWGED